ncbi:conserved hypothetical protein [Vibrio chagasii]|nr:conserved hypothetical protein [Vibrio chagasii]
MSIDSRIIELGIEIDGVVTWYRDLYVDAKGRKYREVNIGRCDITVYNLPLDTRNYILNKTFSDANVMSIGITLRVGRESYGASLLFSGVVQKANQFGLPDIGINLKCIPRTLANLNEITIEGDDIESLESIAQKSASALGVGLNFDIDNKNISSFSYSGKDSGLLKLLRTHVTPSVNVFIDGDILHFVREGYLTNIRQTVNISVETGLLEADGVNRRVDIKTLYTPGVDLTSDISLISSRNSVLDGSYLVTSIGFDVSNRALPFYLHIEALRYG